MDGIKVSMVLWIAFLILTKSSTDESFYVANVFSEESEEQNLEELQVTNKFSEKTEEQSWESFYVANVFSKESEEQNLEELQVTNNFSEKTEEQSWEELQSKQKLKKKKRIIPDCIPNFFMPVLKPCKCIGSGKTIEENEVGILYCFPQPNKFKAKIKDSKYKTISTPDEYENNMVPNKELKSCIPHEDSSVEEICFCGTEKDKNKLKNDGSQNFVNLKHVCVPLFENEKTHSFSLLTNPHQKLPYCYRNRCHRNAHVIQQNFIGDILNAVSVGRMLLKYLKLIERISLAGTDRYTRFEIQRLVSADDDDIARILFENNKSILWPVIQCFESNTIGCGTANQKRFSLRWITFDRVTLKNKFWEMPNFEIILQNSEINRLFPIFGTLKFSFKQLNDDMYLNIGIKKVEKNKFYMCSDLSTKNFEETDFEIQDECNTANFSIQFYPEKEQIYFREEPYDLSTIWFKGQAPTTESTFRFIADFYKFFSQIKD